MKKSIVILIISVVLISFFKTTDFRISLWYNPSINTKSINTPLIPLSIVTDISIFGLFFNFFSDLELDYSINNTDYTVAASFIDDIAEHIDIQFSEDVFEESFFEKVEDVVEEPIVEEVIEDKIETPINSTLAAKKKTNNQSELQEKKKPTTINPTLLDANKKANNQSEVSELEEKQNQTTINSTLDANKKANNQSEVSELEKKQKPTTIKVNKDVEEPLHFDNDVIMQNPNIKKNAKKTILESLEDGEMTINDVGVLLKQYACKTLEKSDVKEYIIQKKKNTTKIILR